MIDEVTFDKTTYADLPHKFEAGTPNICGGIAFGAALDYMNNIGFDAIERYEEELLDYATSKLNQIEGLRIYGNTKHKTAVISFNIDSFHPMTSARFLIRWDCCSNRSSLCTTDYGLLQDSWHHSCLICFL